MLAELNRLRRKVTGLSPPLDFDTNSYLSNGDACLDGYIKPWIDLIKDFTKVIGECPPKFCSTLADYAIESPKEQLAFIEVWKKVAEVPEIFRGSLSRIDRYDAINSLRNKLAHVPVPYQILEELHWGLRQEILSLMIPEYKSKDDSPTVDPKATKWFPVLKGRLSAAKHYVTGSDFGQDAIVPLGGQDVVYMQSLDAKTDPWIVSPFVHPRVPKLSETESRTQISVHIPPGAGKETSSCSEFCRSLKGVKFPTMASMGAAMIGRVQSGPIRKSWLNRRGEPSRRNTNFAL